MLYCWCICVSSFRAKQNRSATAWPSLNFEKYKHKNEWMFVEYAEWWWNRLRLPNQNAEILFCKKKIARSSLDNFYTKINADAQSMPYCKHKVYVWHTLIVIIYLWYMQKGKNRLVFFLILQKLILHRTMIAWTMSLWENVNGSK